MKANHSVFQCLTYLPTCSSSGSLPPHCLYPLTYETVSGPSSMKLSIFSCEYVGSSPKRVLSRRAYSCLTVTSSKYDRLVKYSEVCLISKDGDVRSKCIMILVKMNHC